MNQIEKDKKRSKRGSNIAALVIIIASLLYISLFIFIFLIDPEPISKVMLVLFGAIYVAVIAGALIALVNRHKEIDKGELYEAKKHKNY